MAQVTRAGTRLDSEAIKKGLVGAGIPESQIEISEVGRLGYATDVGPISLTPLAVVGVHSHADVEKAVKYAYDHAIPITARGAGSGLPAQSVGAGIVLDMRSMDKIEVLGDHRRAARSSWPGGRHLYPAEQFLEGHGVFVASYPASTDMATVAA